MDARRILAELFDAALRAVDGRVSVERFLRAHRTSGPVAVIAVGKAAAAMANGAHAALGPQVERMLVITKEGHRDPALDGISGVLQRESAHPMPDIRSLDHGAELVETVRSLRDGVLPLFLVSGGSSSLVEVLLDGVSLADLSALNARGLENGWDIGRLNAARVGLSRIKGGGIARLLAGRPALALFISDVPGDDPDVIGSGLLGRDAGRGDAIERHVVANNDMAVDAVVEAALAHGLRLDRIPARFAADAGAVAGEFLAQLRECESDGLAWGGESTVVLPATHGEGGRNSHLALIVARELRAAEPWMLLAAGTDGTDGSSTDAGAIVDRGTIERAEIAGCDVERAFAGFDSGTALEASGDLLHTGPTGTNVGDLLIAIKQSAASLRGHRLPRML